jgi:biotin synthase-like enzyme
MGQIAIPENCRLSMQYPGMASRPPSRQSVEIGEHARLAKKAGQGACLFSSGNGRTFMSWRRHRLSQRLFRPRQLFLPRQQDPI